MSVAKRIAMSSRLEKSVRAAAQLPINENDFVKLELGEKDDVIRLKTGPLRTYQWLIDEIIDEITPELKQGAGTPNAQFDYRWGVLRIHTGRLMSDDRTVLIVPLLRLESTSDKDVQAREVAFFTKDKSRFNIVQWQSPPADQPLPMYLLPKECAFGVRKPYALFISMTFAQKLPIEDGAGV
ncbi:hypothetical protein GGR55DRAFT_683365 [Xylaria sp. FL0064]|nr:hypothetical protein GGR55DRAFT_684659 [Xylaria sp. FL0064]KAI0802426.1 hypothetical protein GGR55DRAFT_683365 [Xylaria sp. FL0064]